MGETPGEKSLDKRGVGDKMTRFSRHAKIDPSS
jgi:hypothetical protein